MDFTHRKWTSKMKKVKSVSGEVKSVSSDVKSISGELKSISGKMKSVSSEVKSISSKQTVVLATVGHSMCSKSLPWLPSAASDTWHALTAMVQRDVWRNSWTADVQWTLDTLSIEMLNFFSGLPGILGQNYIFWDPHSICIPNWFRKSLCSVNSHPFAVAETSVY